MKTTLKFIILLLILVVFYCCQDDTRMIHIDPNAPAPAIVTNISQASIPGAVVLTYSIPSDPNLSYVKAVYDIRPGYTCETIGSFYADTLLLAGFGDTLSHTVKIFSVGRNNKESEPIILTVKAKIPPAFTTLETIQLDSTFGGISVGFKNVSHAELRIITMCDTLGIGKWNMGKIIYTKADSGFVKIKGYKSTERRKFGIYVQDRWGNKSDTIIKWMTPLYEVRIPNTGTTPFKLLYLPGDLTNNVAEGGIVNSKYTCTSIIDNICTEKENILATHTLNRYPQCFTIDLAQTVQFSQIKLWHRTGYNAFSSTSVYEFEAYGSATLPNLDGSWDNWTLLAPRFTSFRPSGLPYGTSSTTDNIYGSTLGEDFYFNKPSIPVRYVRFKIISNWAKSTNGLFNIAEVGFFGQILK